MLEDWLPGRNQTSLPPHSIAVSMQSEAPLTLIPAPSLVFTHKSTRWTPGVFVCTGGPLRCCPEGTIENSPAFQRWVEREKIASPEGTAEVQSHTPSFSRPFGTCVPRGIFPALKRRAILKMSLRDKGTWRPLFLPRKPPDSLAMSSRPFSGCGVPPGRCGAGPGPQCPAEKNVGHAQS
jgi:hypothetical protein